MFYHHYPTTMELLLGLLGLLGLGLLGRTLCDENGPAVVVVEEGRDVVLPCSLSPEEDIESELFDWRSDDQNHVFLYDNGLHYNNGRQGQSEQFKGRVSHFPNELKHGNASIIIRNTKISDSGEYSCDFPLREKIEIFHIKLVVVAPEPDINVIDATDEGVLLQCEVRGAAPKLKVEWQDRDGNQLPAKELQVPERGDRDHITLQTTVTQTGYCRCVVTQEETNRRTHAEIYVVINVSWTKLSTRAGILVGVGVGVAATAFLLQKNIKNIKNKSKDKEASAAK